MSAGGILAQQIREYADRLRMSAEILDQCATAAAAVPARLFPTCTAAAATVAKELQALLPDIDPGVLLALARELDARNTVA